MKKYIIIVDNHTVFLEGLLSILKAQENYCTLFTSNTMKNVIKYLHINTSKQVDMIIINIETFNPNDIELNQEIKRDFPYIKILMVGTENNIKINKLLKSRSINGYISKNAKQRELLRAIRFVLSGKQFFPKTTESAATIKKESKLNDIRDSLSDRERDILFLITKEYRTKDIAEKLSLSKHTIDGYRKNMMIKLGTRNVVGLAIWSMKLGFDNHCLQLNK